MPNIKKEFKPLPTFSVVEKVAVESVYENSKDAIEAAMLMNPTNYYYDLVGNFSPQPAPFFFKRPIIDKTGKILYPQLSLGLPTGLINVTNYEWFEMGDVYHGIILKTVPGTPSNLFCAAGISTSFACFIGDFKFLDKEKGFPKTSASQCMLYTNNWLPPPPNKDNNANLTQDNPKRYDFYPEVHWERGNNKFQGYLTNAGVELFKKVLNLKGAVYSIQKPEGDGHIGMVMGAQLEEVNIPNKGLKYRGWLYTLEFNTRVGSFTDEKQISDLLSKNDFYTQNLKAPPVNYATLHKKTYIKGYVGSSGGDDRTGGKLAFRIRLIGGLWGKDKKGRLFDGRNFIIGGTEHFNGGEWNPNGLGSDHTYSFIGSWMNNKHIFEP